MRTPTSTTEVHVPTLLLGTLGVAGAKTLLPTTNFTFKIFSLHPFSSPDCLPNGLVFSSPCSCLWCPPSTHSPQAFQNQPTSQKVLRTASLKSRSHFRNMQKESKLNTRICRRADSTLTIRGQLIFLGGCSLRGQSLKSPDSGPGPRQFPLHGTLCGK